MDKLNCKVSIIIPAYNAEEYILRSIESCINQTYKNIEVLVINDGSTDNTERIAIEYSDDRIKVISTQNGGVSCARNVGIENSTGDFLMFLDADDALTLDAVELMLGLVLEYDADMCVCSRYRIKDLNKKPNAVAVGIDQNVVLEGKAPLLNSILDHPMGYNVTSRLFSKELIDDVRFVEGKNVHEDSYFSFECYLKQPKVVVSGAKTYNYYVTPNSISRGQVSEKHLAILYFADKKAERIKELYPEYEGAIPGLLAKSRVSLLHILSNSKDKKFKKYEKECIKYVIKNKKSYFKMCNDKKDIKFLRIITFHMYWIYKKIKLKRKNK